RSLSQFLLQIGTFVAIFFLTMAVTAVHLHIKRWLQLDWREWMTARLLDHWMYQGQHYQLLYVAGEHDNPDGRIAEDIRIVTESTIALGHTLFYSLLILFSFVDILLAVSGTANVPGTDVSVPGYMVWMAFLYAGVGAALGFLLGRPLIRSTNTLQTAEADFRFGLSRARENSEAIALMQGERVERSLSARLFAGIAKGWNKQTLAYTWIVSYSAGYGALLPVFPLLIAAPQYIAGTMTLGILMQAAQAFQKLTSALSWPVDNLGEIARCRASADRVLSLYEDLLQLEASTKEQDACRIEVADSSRMSLELQHLTVANQDGLVLLENFSEVIQRGERVLISGDQSAAIGLFKVVAGLWHWGQGTILLPHDHSIVFMPQRPFLPASTLQAVLSYPAPAETYDLRAMHYALECAGIAWLIPRLDETDVWDRVLTTRAQQRLGFARVFLQQPSWIFIEEATDAFDEKSEDAIMETLRSELPNATVLTISMHAGMEKHHQRKIVLNRIVEEKYLFSDDRQCLLPVRREDVHADAEVLLTPVLRRKSDPK
ncbi:MAG TPA: SbmA/BacA-like family transporter, partial [Pseudomonadales bacterium]|nr:SbmA/BacA-like family transporter [Pseudomonadales bacterium]